MLKSNSVAQGIVPIDFRIFLSSPGDVEPERAAVGRVVDRLNAEGGTQPRFELIRWEEDYYTADSTFQEQIVRSSDCDVVICIFWKRLGSPLPDQYRRDDGTNPTGTEFEFEMAIEAATTTEARMPSLLVYRKTTEVFFSESDLEIERDQYERFKAFWAKWFRNEKAHFTAGFHSFDPLEQFEEMVERHIRKWLKDRDKAIVWTDGSPFAGLRAFGADRREVFFGRSVETDRVRARFVANAIGGVRFLLVQGPSGSGKSSLVSAGVVPRLRVADPVTGLPDLEHTLELTPSSLVSGGHRWQLSFANALFERPGIGDALSEGDFPDPKALAAAIGEGSAGVAALRGALGRMSTEAARSIGLLLVLDQLEEVFDWPTADADDFFAFVTALLADAPVLAIATMRSEFQHRAAEPGPLAALLGLEGLRDPQDPVATVMLNSPKAADLREMIVAPAEAAGLTYEAARADLPPLARRIEAAARATALPALQLLLSELYERREGTVMTHDAYDALGGVSGVMANRGDAILAEASGAEQAAFPELARNLVRTGGDGEPVVSNRLSLGALEASPVAAALARRLMNAGLIVGDENSIRWAHESLIDAWDKLRDLVVGERRLLVIRDRLRSQFQAYRAAGSRRAGLLVGLPLDEAIELREAWGEAALDAQDEGLSGFLRASVRNRRRLRLAGAAVGFAAVVLLASLGWVLVERQRAEVASFARAELLAVSSELRTGRPGFRTRAASHALAAMEAMDTPETLGAGISALMAQVPVADNWQPGTELKAFTYLADGRIVAIDREGALFIDKASAGQIDLRGELPLVLSALPDNGFAIVTDRGSVGFVAITDDAVGDPEWAFSLPDVYLSGAGAVSIVSRPETTRVWIAVGGLRGPVMLTCDRSEETSCEDFELGPLAGATTVAVSPANDSIAAFLDGAGRLGIYDGLSSLYEGQSPGARTIAWHRDGLEIGVGQNGQVTLAIGPWLQLLGLPAGSLFGVGTLRPFAGSVTPITFQSISPDWQMVALPCGLFGPPMICVMDRQTGASRIVYPDGFGAQAVEWSPDGESLTALDWDGSITTRDLGPEAPYGAVRLALPDPMTVMASDPGNATFAVGTSAGNVLIVGPDGAVSRKVSEGRVNHLAFDGSGDLAVAHETGVSLLYRNDASMTTVAQDADYPRVAHLPDGGIAAIKDIAGLTIWASRSAVTGGDETFVPGVFGGVIAAADGSAFITDPDGGILRSDGLTPVAAFQPQPPMDESGGRSLDLHLNGRDLVVTRGDGGARIFDTKGERDPILLPVAAQDTVVAGFSPDGTRAAVLSADGHLHVWRLDLDRRTSDLMFTIQPVPDQFIASQGRRAAVWMDWMSDTEIGVVTSTGFLLQMPVDTAEVQRQLAAVSDRP